MFLLLHILMSMIDTSNSTSDVDYKHNENPFTNNAINLKEAHEVTNTNNSYRDKGAGNLIGKHRGIDKARCHHFFNRKHAPHNYETYHELDDIDIDPDTCDITDMLEFDRCNVPSTPYSCYQSTNATHNDLPRLAKCPYETKDNDFIDFLRVKEPRVYNALYSTNMTKEDENACADLYDHLLPAVYEAALGIDEDSSRMSDTEQDLIKNEDQDQHAAHDSSEEIDPEYTTLAGMWTCGERQCNLNDMIKRRQYHFKKEERKKERRDKKKNKNKDFKHRGNRHKRK